MNMLNSLIIEGTLVPESLRKDSFRIVTTRAYRKADGTVDTEHFAFTVIAHGVIMNFMRTQWEDGRGVCVVGTLVSHRNAVRILAEHIEFKPRKAVQDAVKLEACD